MEFRTVLLKDRNKVVCPSIDDTALSIDDTARPSMIPTSGVARRPSAETAMLKCDEASVQIARDVPGMRVVTSEFPCQLRKLRSQEAEGAAPHATA